MSLFRSLLGDFDDDPIFGSHMRFMRHMDNTISSMLSDPFGMMGQNAITNGTHQPRALQAARPPMLFPFAGFAPMSGIFTNFDNRAPNGNSHSFCSRSVMTMSSGANGRPQVYQETMSTTSGPGGVKQTQRTVCDSRTGTKKMAIGHHIGDRAHIMEREQNIYSGEQEERQEFINIDEDDAETFNNEWQVRSRGGGARAIGNRGNYESYAGHSRNRPEYRQLALPDPSTASRQSNSSRWTPTTRRNIRASSAVKGHNTHPTAGSTSSEGTKKTATTATAVAAAATAVTAATATTTTTTPAMSVKKTASTANAANAVVTGASVVVAGTSAIVTSATTMTTTEPEPPGTAAMSETRKREHTPETRVRKRRPAVPYSDV